MTSSCARALFIAAIVVAILIGVAASKTLQEDFIEELARVVLRSRGFFGVNLDLVATHRLVELSDKILAHKK